MIGCIFLRCHGQDEDCQDVVPAPWTCPYWIEEYTMLGAHHNSNTNRLRKSCADLPRFIAWSLFKTCRGFSHVSPKDPRSFAVSKWPCLALSHSACTFKETTSLKWFNCQWSFMGIIFSNKTISFPSFNHHSPSIFNCHFWLRLFVAKTGHNRGHLHPCEVWKGRQASPVPAKAAISGWHTVPFLTTGHLVKQTGFFLNGNRHFYYIYIW